MRFQNTLNLSFVFASCFALAFVAGSLTFIPGESHADELAQSDVVVEIAPSIAASLSPNTLSLPIEPIPTGKEAKGELVVNVSTNNQTGYSLNMSSASAVTALVHTDTVSTIPTVTNATAGIPNALANNTWGYNIGLASTTSTFLSIPVLGPTTPIAITSVPAQSSATTVTIGARADTSVSAGSYGNTLLFTATANYVPPPPIAAIQDFTAVKCAALAPGETIQRRDNRDDKVYRIRKMADDRCWFIDNLAFEPPTDSSAPGYIAFDPVITLGGSSTDTKAQYVQNNNFEGEGQIPNNGNPIPSYLYNWCAALGDTSEGCLASRVADENDTVIDGAIDTSGTDTNQSPVTGICPAPFRLPKGGPVSSLAYTPTSTANEFVKLDIALGGTGEDWQHYAASYDNWMDADGGTSSSWSGVLSGNFNGSLVNQGSIGYWWSSTALSSTLAYSLSLYSSSSLVLPANYTYKYYGFAVRCVL